MGLPGCKSKGSVHTEKRLQPSTQGKTPSKQNPTSQSGHANALRNKFLQETLHSLLQKQATEIAKVQSSLDFYNRLFLVPKLKNKWHPMHFHPILISLDKFLKVHTFKMQTPESIRLSLQTGESVSSLDFNNANFHIPISHSSQKYLRFHCQNQTFQFTALPFGFSMTPMEFTIVVKEVRPMASSCHI